MRYGTTACTVQRHCAKCGKDDHSTEHHDIHSDVQDRRAARGAKAMSITSTQSDAPGHSFCLMARAAATTSTSLVASSSPTLLLLDEDDDEIVVLVEDEDGSEFKFCGTMSDTFGHSDVIGKIETAIGDRSRIDCDLAGDGFMHAPLTASSFAYLSLPPGPEGIEYLEYPQPVVGMHSHEPIAIAGSPDLSTNENGLFEQATRSWINGINLKTS